MKTPELTLKKTCSMCPEQYELMDENGECVAYFRVRHGLFTVQCPDCGGELVCQMYINGDGCFMPGERKNYIQMAINEVKRHYGWEDDE